MKKIIIVFFLLGFFFINHKLLAEDETYVKTEPVKEVKVEVKIEKVKKTKKIYVKSRISNERLTEEQEEEIKKIFGNKAEIAIGVFQHESGFKIDAVNHNCKYNGKSTFCKKGDTNITSSDCGFAQINIKAKSCPAELLTFEGSLKAAEKVYKSQGLSAWASYNNKSYLAFMN